MKPRIAIIGAGISGLSLAHALRDIAEITVFEKARGVGGRMATRYADAFYFDHGTQFFTARTKAFKKFLAPHIASGLVAPWHGKVITLEAGKKPKKRLWFEPHYAACPNMNSLCKALAEPLDVRVSTELKPLPALRDNGWHLHDSNGNDLGVFDWVISTAPPAQTATLFHAHLPENAPLNSVAMTGCYALMLGFNAPWDKPWIAARIKNSSLDWLAINSTKPTRNANVTCMVAHSRADWADAHIDDAMDDAQRMLCDALKDATGIDASTADFVTTHRWKYAQSQNAKAHAPYIDAAQKLASTGDWCHASRIEDAWHAAHTLAQTLRTAPSR